MAQQTLSKKGAATRVTPEKPAKPAKVTAAKAVAAPKLDISAQVEAASKALAPAVKNLTKALAAMDPAGLPVGSLVDALYDLRQLSKVLASITKPLDELIDPKVKQVEDHFIQTLAVGESSGVQGKKSRVQVTEAVRPTITDWDKFYAYIKKNNAFELLNRAPNRVAITERWDAKKQIPGVGSFHDKKVSCTKLSGK
jgi:hypothetical protein